MRTALPALLALAVACGCAGRTGSEAVDMGLEVQAGLDVPEADGTGGEEGAGGDVTTDATVPDVPADPAGPDQDACRDPGPPDLPADSPPPPDATDPCAPPRAVGCACTSYPECAGGLCVETDDGRRCSAACQPGDVSCMITASDWCKLPWALQEVHSQVFGDQWVCLPLHPGLCRPCQSDEDCATYAAAACLPYGDAGSFCGTRCDAIVTCPDGYACDPLAAPLPDIASACRLASGECPCSQAAIAAGASTSCARTNGDGTCPGSRQCGTAGLTACDAPVPSPPPATCTRTR